MVRYGAMVTDRDFAVVQLTNLAWPPLLSLPTTRFRLLVAADVREVGDGAIAQFASAALNAEMVYFCAWGPDCERFHDIVDSVLVNDDKGARRYAGPRPEDIVMTTWHDDESLEEALDFLATCAVPTDGLTPDSSFRLVMCVDNPSWAATATQFLRSAEFFV